MTSISFPNIFKKGNATELVDDLAATKQNTLLLLKSEKGELFGDPYFGIRLRRYLFDQNNYILKDVIIDEIYTQLALFMPQLRVERENIDIIQERAKLYCSFKATNQIDFTTDMYQIVLYNADEENKGA